MRQTTSILGIPVDNLDTQATLNRIEQFIHEGRFHQVATANVDFLINAMQDQELREILREADLVTPDGMPVVWASRLLGTPLPERVTGADLVPRLAELAAAKGYRIYMLGAQPDVARRARARMMEANPGLQIVGCVSPDVAPLLAMDSDTLLDDICAAKPDVLLVAFGNPKQEKWIHLHRDRLRHVPVCIGVGGTFDFLAGKTSRAPMWMQRCGMEWLYRLAHEPKRLWRRYKNDVIYFTQFLARQWWATRSQRGSTAGQVRTEQRGGQSVVRLSGVLNSNHLAELERPLAQAIERSPSLILDVQPGCSLDAAVCGTLINLTKRADHTGCEVRIAGVSPALHALLRATRMKERMEMFPSVEEALLQPPHCALQVTRSCNGAWGVYTLRGSADYRQVETVKTWLYSSASAFNVVDLDLSGVNYIDCGMLDLLRCFCRSTATAGRCVRMRVNPLVHSALVREKILHDFVLINDTDVPSVLKNLSNAALIEQGHS